MMKYPNIVVKSIDDNTAVHVHGTGDEIAQMLFYLFTALIAHGFDFEFIGDCLNNADNFHAAGCKAVKSS